MASNELRDKTLPIRYSLKEIEALKNEIKMYVVLPIPETSGSTPFETIGRTTFKKYIKKLYEKLQWSGELPPGSYVHIPFVILKNARDPYVVHIQDEIKTEPIEIIEIDSLAPPHHEMKRFKLSGTDLDIQITNEHPKTYYNCATFDANLLNGDYWHLIVVQHERRLTKQQILDQLFAVVSDSEFFPVCYTQSKLEDYFLIRLCRNAIEKLFQHKLRLMVGNQTVYLSVMFQVAQFKLGQIYPSKKYTKAINEQMQKLIFNYENESQTKVLDLDKFSLLKEFEHIYVNLANKMSLQLLFTTLDTLNTKTKLFEKINGIRLSNNGIKTLDPASKLPIIDLKLVDLRHNNIRTVNELINLKRIKIQILLLDGNPCVENVGFKRDILELFPDLEKLDNVILKPVNPPPSTSASSSVPILNLPSQIPDVLPIEITNNNEIFTWTDADFDLRKFEKYKNPLKNCWHQVIVHHHGKLSQTEILDALFDEIAPNDFLPCYYRPYSTYDLFFVRDCYDALEILYYKKLKVQTSANLSLPIVLKMNVAEIKDGQLDPIKIMQKVVDGRYDIMNHFLNLERFADNDAFENILYRISIPRTLTNVLTYASRKFGHNVVALKLGYNGLKSARGMHPLIWMKGLKEIDLSNNKIEEAKQIEPMPKGTVTSLWLEGNPLCLKYSNPNTYISAIKEFLPNLEYLDGHDISKPASISIKQNFVCNLEGYDLAEQFVQHYFTCFDSVNRSRAMKGVYHNNAILTMSINSSGMPDNIAKRMSPIIDKCRNFKRVVSSNASQNVFQGSERIASLLGIFGQTEHDFTTFTIDMTTYTPIRAMITVNGIFRETARSLNEEDVILGFSRTFLIGRQAEKLGMFHASEEFQIYNDIVLYYRPSMQQLDNCFKIRRHVMANDNDEVTDDDKLGLEIIFHELTGLNSTWCKKILSAASWNFRESLESFTQLLRDNQIPQHAFN